MVKEESPEPDLRLDFSRVPKEILEVLASGIGVIGDSAARAKVVAAALDFAAYTYPVSEEDQDKRRALWTEMSMGVLRFAHLASHLADESSHGDGEVERRSREAVQNAAEAGNEILWVIGEEASESVLSVEVGEHEDYPGEVLYLRAIGEKPVALPRSMVHDLIGRIQTRFAPSAADKSGGYM